MRWMPPEAIQRRKFSEKSDVWAFGVLLWELWSYAQIPFHLISNDEEVARRTHTNIWLHGQLCAAGGEESEGTQGVVCAYVCAQEGSGWEVGSRMCVHLRDLLAS